MMDNNKKQHPIITKVIAFKDNLLEKRKTKQAHKKEQIEHEDNEPKRTFWVQIRLIPIWLRIILIALLLVLVSIIGLQIGFSYIGDGDPKDVLKKETWTHILDIIDGKE